MATPSLRRVAWPSAAVLAAAFIVVLAFHGQRPGPGLVPFEAGGLMALPPERIEEVEVEADGKRWRLRRGAEGTWSVTQGPPVVAGDPQAQIERGLRLLHVSGPERTLTREELGGAAAGEFGLAPPELTVRARGGSSSVFTVHFGRKNPLGLARYARVEGRDEVVLLPGFVAEAWEALVKKP